MTKNLLCMSDCRLPEPASEFENNGTPAALRSEKLDADTVEWFTENGGMSRKNGDHFRKALLSKGGTMDAMQMYREFRGRDAKIEPLLERRGLKAN